MFPVNKNNRVKLFDRPTSKHEGCYMFSNNKAIQSSCSTIQPQRNQCFYMFSNNKTIQSSYSTVQHQQNSLLYMLSNNDTIQSKLCRVVCVNNGQIFLRDCSWFITANFQCAGEPKRASSTSLGCVFTVGDCVVIRGAEAIVLETTACRQQRLAAMRLPVEERLLLDVPHRAWV